MIAVLLAIDAVRSPLPAWPGPPDRSRKKDASDSIAEKMTTIRLIGKPLIPQIGDNNAVVIQFNL